MLIAQVILDIPTKGINKVYSYRVPSQIEEESRVGCLCVVPLGSRFVLAWIIKLNSACDALDTCPDRELKDICEILSPSYLSEADARLALWMAHYYMAPLSSALRLFVPTAATPRISSTSSKKSPYTITQSSVRQHYTRFVCISPYGREVLSRDDSGTGGALRRAPKQYELMRKLAISPASIDEITSWGFSARTLVSGLQSKGYVETWELPHYCIGSRRIIALDSSDIQDIPATLLEYLKFEQKSFYVLVSLEEDKRAPVTFFHGGTEQKSLGTGSGGIHTLTHEQEAAYREFYRLLEKQEAQEIPPIQKGSDCPETMHACESLNPTSPVLLIDGVTGSGKTEVYMRACEEVLARGKTAIVLVPEITLSSQMAERFRERFGFDVALLHSAMNPQERFDQLELIRRGFARLVLGPRSALFAPLKNKGLIIIDEEHERTYKQEQAPRYDARLVAQKMMEVNQGLVILGSATPSIMSLYNVGAQENWTCSRLTERANKTNLPPISLIDMSLEFRSGLRSMFSRELAKEICAALKERHKVVLLLNQRGFAQFLLCRDCGYVPLCPACEMSLTVHEDKNLLRCHYCNHEEEIPALCPQCQSPYLKRFGAGTQRVESALKELLHGEGLDVPVIRMDADTTQRKNSHALLLEQFAQAKTAVLLGTQMIAKGLDFPDIALVGVINADTQLYLPDYRSQEMSFSLIEQVAGRAGRHEVPGKVLVQSYNPQNVAIRAASRYDRETFLNEEMTKRQEFRYPPFVRFINVLIWSESYELLKQEAQNIYDQIYTQLAEAKLVGTQDHISFEAFAQKSIHELLVDDISEVDDVVLLMPPSPCSFAKIRNAWRYHILIKSPLDLDIQSVLEPCVRALRYNKQVSCAIDVDPQSLL